MDRSFAALKKHLATWYTHTQCIVVEANKEFTSDTVA
jgi:hypothetical protein